MFLIALPKMPPNSVKANGDSSAPPPENAPVPADLYSTVDKSIPQVSAGCGLKSSISESQRLTLIVSTVKIT